MFNTTPAVDGSRREPTLSLRDKINQLEEHVRKLLLKSKEAIRNSIDLCESQKREEEEEKAKETQQEKAGGRANMRRE